MTYDTTLSLDDEKQRLLVILRQQAEAREWWLYTYMKICLLWPLAEQLEPMADGHLWIDDDSG